MPGWFLDPETTKHFPLQGCCCGTRASCVEDGGGQHVRENTDELLSPWNLEMVDSFWILVFYLFFLLKQKCENIQSWKVTLEVMII